MQIETLTKKMPLSINPYQVYGLVTEQGNKVNTALLETAEAGTHNNQKSIIMLSAAAKISCNNDQVVIESLNINGEQLIKCLQKNNDLKSNFKFELKTNELLFRLKPVVSSFDEEVRLIEPSTLDILRTITNMLTTESAQDDQSSMLIGAISFDAVDQFEKIPKIKKKDEDYCFYLADELIVQNADNQSAKIIVKGFGQNAKNIIHLGLKLKDIESKLHQDMVPDIKNYSANAVVKDSSDSDNYHVDVSDKDFFARVKRAKEHILVGDVFQVVLSRTFSLPCRSPFFSYGILRNNNPSPYMYFFNFEDKYLFGASPESALKIDSKKNISVYPIAGTRKRSFNSKTKLIDYENDSKIEFELISDEKEASEHMMLVDLARNDLARVVKNGTRKITQLKKIVKYSHVMHMVSEIKGILKDELDGLYAYKACANMGTLTGAPKIKAMHIIRNNESSSRGFYGGAVCVMNANQEFDSAIVIRSAVVKDNVAYVSAGAGIVNDSIPKLEALETLHKARAVLEACSVVNPSLKDTVEVGVI